MNKMSNREMWSSCRNSLLLTSFWVFAMVAIAQNTPVNLVPNGSFELHTGCPTSSSGLNQLDDWSIHISSVDYYHRCAEPEEVGIPLNSLGYKQPFELADSAFVGVVSFTTFFQGGQESLFSNLAAPLTAGIKYRVKFKASYSDSANYAVCCIGVMLSNVPPPSPPFVQNISSVELVLEESQYDTSSWFQYEGVYTASGGEDKIYLGTFRPESDLNPILVRPLGNHYYDIAYFYVDDVEVYEDELVTTAILEEPLRLNMNHVAADGIFEISTDRSMCVELFDISGRKVYETVLSNGSNHVNVSTLPNGLYVAVFVENGRQQATRKVVICN